MNAVRSWFTQYALQLVVLLLVIGSMYALYPEFRVESSIERLIPLGVIAAGLAVTMIAGEFDLSIASMAALAGALTVVLSENGLIASLLIAIAVCTLLGMIQGWAIATLGINSLVFTVGTLVLIRGLTWLVCDGLAISIDDITASDIFYSRLLFLSPGSIVALCWESSWRAPGGAVSCTPSGAHDRRPLPPGCATDAAWCWPSGSQRRAVRSAVASRALCRARQRRTPLSRCSCWASPPLSSEA
jgi:hypothetical protein